MSQFGSDSPFLMETSECNMSDTHEKEFAKLSLSLFPLYYLNIGHRWTTKAGTDKELLFLRQRPTVSVFLSVCVSWYR